jgi:hypothetical protein
MSSVNSIDTSSMLFYATYQFLVNSHCSNGLKQTTESRGLVISNPDLYSEGPGFKSRSGDRLS